MKGAPTKKEKKSAVYRLLTEKEKKFCVEYLKDRNATQAYIRTGYSPTGADANAIRLIGKDRVRAKINELIAQQLNRLKLSADLVIKELLKSATIDIKDAYDEEGNLLSIQDMPEPLRKAIITIETEELFDGRGEDRERIGTTKTIKISDRLRALELLGKHLKMFTDVHEIPGLEGLAERMSQAEQRLRKCKPSPKKKT